MKQRPWLGALLGLVLGSPGLAWSQEKLVPLAPSPLSRYDGCTIVFVVNGAAGSTVISDNLSEAIAEKRAAALLAPVPWTREEMPLADFVDQEAQLLAAGKLARHIAVLRHEAPNARIILVAHSAGTRVALAAAENCPDRSINRIILLGAAVSCNYDLRGALRASRGGIDSFYSQDDTILDVAASTVGTADGRQDVSCAGVVGFRPYRDPAYCGLRQHEWAQFRPGRGGHYSWAWPGFMRNVIVPMTQTEMMTPKSN